jgi:hypothetical protein
MKKSATFVDDFCFLCGLVFGDFACDIFLSLRMLIVAQITIACIMFVVLNHGVINVIFSVLAIAFAMEIDDKFMEALVNFGFSETPVYILQIKPALACVMADDMRTLAMNRRGQDAEGNRTQDAMSPVVKTSRMFMKRNLWGLQIANWWALVLTTALFSAGSARGVRRHPTCIAPVLHPGSDCRRVRRVFSQGCCSTTRFSRIPAAVTFAQLSESSQAIIWASPWGKQRVLIGTVC